MPNSYALWKVGDREYQIYCNGPSFLKATYFWAVDPVAQLRTNPYRSLEHLIGRITSGKAKFEAAVIAARAQP